MRVAALETECRKQVFELVLFQFRFNEPHKAERVETSGTPPPQLHTAATPLQIVLKNVVIVTGVMPEKHAVAHIVDEHEQRLFPVEQFVAAHLLYHRILHVAQHARYLPVGGDEERQSRAFHYLPVSHPHRSNLHDVVLEDIESGGLGVEHHDV